MNFKTYIFSFSTLLIACLASAQMGNPNRGSSAVEQEYLFPGTGFFVKNRKPYEENEAKLWFKEAYNYEMQQKSSKAMKLYEKFSKRRSDAYIELDGKVFLVGPESLFRAAKIREEKGDWSKSFDHLKLIAQAYTNYNFELVADSLMRVTEKFAKEKLPRKWGFFPRFKSGSQNRSRLNEIANLARGPKFAPRALMALAEISIKDEKHEEAIDALDRLINLYPENYHCEKAYFLLATIYRDLSSGISYDQSKTMKSLNYFEDYLILFQELPSQGKHESKTDFDIRRENYSERRQLAENGRVQMRERLASSKFELGNFTEKYGKYYLTNWRTLGNKPSLQFYNEAITIAPESDAARKAEVKISELEIEDN